MESTYDFIHEKEEKEEEDGEDETLDKKGNEVRKDGIR